MKFNLTQHLCTVDASYLAGVSNVEADHLSRLESDRNNYTIKLSILT